MGNFFYVTMMVWLLFTLGCQSLKAKKEQIFYGGDILTMSSASPNYVESLVVKSDKIVFLGSSKEAFSRFPNAQKNFLSGKTLLPGFLDGHGHFYNTGLVSLVTNLLPPPDGEGADFKNLVNQLKQWSESKNGHLVTSKLGWVIGNGYDDSQLKEKKHPTKEVLDKVSKTMPVLIIHQSGHLGVVNSKALELLGIDNKTKDPKGGVIRRAKGSLEPNGVLEENAFIQVAVSIFQSVDKETQMLAVKAAQTEYLKNGYTTAQDGRSTSDVTAALSDASKKKNLLIDVVAYPDIIMNKSVMSSEFYSKSYKNHYRIGGVKLTLDGSPQGKTAWLSHPYHIPPNGRAKSYSGYSIMSDADAVKYVTEAFQNKWQIIAHTNGDAAIDQYLRSIKQAQKKHDYLDHRSVLIHGQTLRKDQIPTLVKLRVLPSLFPMHTFYWGDWHVNSVLGLSRAEYISPTRDVLNAGLTLTSHHDAPVTFPNSMRVLDATVNRVTRSGKILGPSQRLSPYEGLKTLTDWAAQQYFEEDSKGTLDIGKRADLVVLSKNPLKVPSLSIKDIEIIEVYKDGKKVFENLK